MLKSSIPLSDDEWKAVNSDLPNVREVIDRIISFEQAEWISLPNWDMERLRAIRKSRVRLHDAQEKLRSARYALGQAIATRKYYLERVIEERDDNHIQGHWLSRFYADYVPLLLTSCIDHTVKGYKDLYDLTLSSKKGDVLQKLLFTLEEARPQDPMTSILKIFDNSEERAFIFKYRHDWVHQKPPRVETIFYNPPYTDGISNREDFPWDMYIVGYASSPDYSWEDFVRLLKISLVSTVKILDVFATEWEKLYQQNAE